MKKVIFVCDLCGWQMTEPWVTIPIETGERHLCEFCTEKVRTILMEPKATKAEEPKEEKPKRRRIDQANDENGEMIEEAIQIPMNFCPNCGRDLTKG